MRNKRARIPDRWRGPLLALILVVAVVILIFMARTIYAALTSNLEDFYLYYLAASAFQQKLDVYHMNHWSDWQPIAQALDVPTYAPPYRYPPLLAVMIMPLLSLPARQAGFVWTVISAAAVMGSTTLLAATMPDGVKRLPLMWIVTVLFLPVLSTLYAGQVNTLVLLSIALALWSFKRDRPIQTGLALSLGVMLKLMPITLVAYFLWRRQWRVVVGTLAGIVLLTLVCVPFVGWEPLLSYGQQMISRADPHTFMVNPQNQSLLGLTGRLLTGYSWGAPWTDNPELAWTLGRGLGWLILAVTFIVCWPGRPVGKFLLEEVSLVIIATLLLPSICWYHHLILLLIPLFALLWNRDDHPRQRGLQRIALGCLVLIDLQGVLWVLFLQQPLLLSLATYATLALWVTLAWLVLRQSCARFAHPGAT